jgi:hypothetical protein
MLFIPHEAAVLAGAGTDLRSGDDADPQVPTWHVARAEAYDAADARTPARDDNDWAIDEDTDSDEFDSYEEFTSENPADSAVTPESQGDEPGRRD